MAITTHAELVTALTNWTQRSDISSRSPEWIVLAEAAFNRGFSETSPFRAVAQEASTTVSCTEYTSVPTDYLELRGIKGTWTGAKQRLEYMTPELLDLQYSNATSSYPKHYTIEGAQIRVGPPPSGSLSIKILYYQKITALASGSNWVITNHPDLYLFGALFHGHVYSHNTPEYIDIKNAYTAAVNQLRASANRIRFGGGALQTVAA